MIRRRHGPKERAGREEGEGQEGQAEEGQAEEGPGGSWPSNRFPSDGVIKVLVKKNPKRPTSAAGKRFDLYKPGMTVAEFLKAGGLRADLRWDAKQGFIEVTKPA